MNDLPSTMLLQQSMARPVSGEELETLGKQAAAQYLSGAFSMNAAVIETVKHAGLSPEQVKRVAEFANTEAYLSEFNKEGGAHKVVDFAGGPADASAILKDLNDGGGGTIMDRGSRDYELAPPNVEKLSSTNEDRLGFENAKLAEAFKVEDPGMPYAEPTRDAHDLYVKLAGAYDRMVATVQELEGAFLDLNDRLFEGVKTAALDGVPLGYIVQAWSEVVDEPELMKVAFKMLSQRLLDNDVFDSRDDMAGSLAKTASAVSVNAEHPLVVDFNEWAGTIQKLAGYQAARDELATGLDTLGTFLKAAGKKVAADRASELGKVVGGAVKGGWGAAKGVSKAVAKPAAEFAGSAVGPLAGKGVGFAVEHAPEAAALLGAESLYQHLKYLPAAQATKNFALARVPYTQPWVNRQYNLQMAGMM